MCAVDGVGLDGDDECKNSQRMLMQRGETKCININYSGPKMASLVVVGWDINTGGGQ